MPKWTPCPSFVPPQCLSVAPKSWYSGVSAGIIKFHQGPLVERRASGAYANQGLFLNDNYSWAIVRDDEGSLVLVCTFIGANKSDAPSDDWIDCDDEAAAEELAEPDDEPADEP